jgi:hypothetical protein
MGRLPSLALLGVLLVSARSARAETRALYVAAIADYSGHGSGRALHEQLEAALQTEGVPLVNATALAASAQQAGVTLDRTPSDEAAARLAFQVPLAGVLLLRPSKHHQLSVVLVDGQGQHLLATELHAPRSPSASDVAALASQVSAALRAAAAGEPSPTPAPAPIPRAPAPALIPMLRAALAPALATRTYSLPGLFTYQNDSPYGALVASAELFPFDDADLHGLGLLAAFQYGIAQARIGTAPSFQQTDLRLDFDFAYRFIPVTGPYGPAVQGTLGIGYRAFNAPSSSGIANDDRTYFGLGIALAQPLVPRILRLEASLTWLPVANATTPAATQQTYSSSTGSGFEWSVGLAGVPVGPVEFALRIDQQRFYDTYPASEGQAGASGTDVFTSYQLVIAYVLK